MGSRPSLENARVHGSSPRWWLWLLFQYPRPPGTRGGRRPRAAARAATARPAETPLAFASTRGRAARAAGRRRLPRILSWCQGCRRDGTPDATGHTATYPTVRGSWPVPGSGRSPEGAWPPGPEASGSRGPGSACSGLAEGEVEGRELHLPGGSSVASGGAGAGARPRSRPRGPAKKASRKPGKSPPSSSQSVRRVRELRAVGVRPETPGAPLAHSQIRPLSPALGAERDWPHPRSQVARQGPRPEQNCGREDLRRQLVSGPALKAAARRPTWEWGGELGLLPKSRLKVR